MTRKLSIALVVLLLVTLVVPQTTSAYHASFPLDVSIGRQLWSLTRHELYPNTVHTSGQTSRVRAIWLGTQTNGNGTDWRLMVRDPATPNGTINIPMRHYTHMAIVFVCRSNATVNHFVDNVRVTNFTRLSTNEVYNASGQRIVNDFIVFSGSAHIIPLDTASTSNIYRLNTVDPVGGTQNHTITINWT